jgi:hypothetical protein
MISRTPNMYKQPALRDGVALGWRRFAYPVGGSVSVFDWRFAVGVGDLREHVRPALGSPFHAYSLHSPAFSPSRVAHTNTLTHSLTRPATRLTRLGYHLDVPPLSNRSVS